MVLQFPDDFFWGSSTSAAQVETASLHNWKGIKTKDGHTFDRTTDHEKRRDEDIENIAQFGTVYRCSVDWARLQSYVYAPFDPEVVEEYQVFFELLAQKGVKIMFVLHHFANPVWFENRGGWLNEENVSAYVDFARQCITHFGQYVFNWNTFNEPNVYALNAYLLGNFPPFKMNYFKAGRVLKNLGRAHNIAYKIIKEVYPLVPVGISLNTAYFKGINLLGKIPALFTDWWFHNRAARPFRMVDY
ncbi:MAG: glycoside hydrolase family 1 protein [Cyclobacteriaceae bacterium]|nr:glycoside hydrolase family 1 protein [Cyclobacteriaceae bacterium]